MERDVGYEGFFGRQGQCRVLGQQSQWRMWGAYMESSYFHTTSGFLLTRVFLHPFALEAHHIETLLGYHGFLVTLL